MYWVCRDAATFSLPEVGVVSLLPRVQGEESHDEAALLQNQQEFEARGMDHIWMGWDGVRWDGMEWNGKGRNGIGWERMG